MQMLSDSIAFGRMVCIIIAVAMLWSYEVYRSISKPFSEHLRQAGCRSDWLLVQLCSLPRIAETIIQGNDT